MSYAKILQKTLSTPEGRIHLLYALSTSLSMWIKYSKPSWEKDIIEYSEEFPFKDQLLDFILTIDPNYDKIQLQLDDRESIWAHILKKYREDCDIQEAELLKYSNDIKLEQDHVINRQTVLRLGNKTYKFTNGYDGADYAQVVYIGRSDKEYVIWPTNPRKKKYRGRIGKIIGYNGTDPRNVLSTPIDTVRFKFKDSGQVAYIPIVDLCYSS